jgi:OOP family OmpA-OmpF porin
MGYLVDQRGNVARSGFGLCWHSGVGPAPASTAECDPNYVPVKVVEAAQKPPAVAAAAPQPAAKPAPQRVTLDADTLFDFDKAVLRPAGKVALDAFVGQMKDINPEMINAVGHTDRFGSEAYNQRLSEQRVAAVKTYLVSQGIEANRMHTEGKGETQPVTKAGECDGAKSAKVIACLQPDRRVEIEVVGDRIAK